MMPFPAVAVKTFSEQILPYRRAALVATAAFALTAGGCGLDADEETSTATTATPVTGSATGPSGPSGPTGPTGPTGEEGEQDGG